MAEKYVPVFFDWIEATQELNDQEKGRLIDAIVLYARGGDWQERIKGNERYAFPVFRLQVDRSNSISSARAQARSKAEQTGTKSTNANKREQNEQTSTKSLTNTNTNTNTRESDKRKRFAAPTLKEVEDYCTEKGYTNFNAQRFVDYYESKGWLVGKSPMKDWKAALRGWVSRDESPSPSSKAQAAPNPALNYQQREYNEHDFDDLYLDLEEVTRGYADGGTI